ncbi:MAG: hypothetical protein ACOYXM_04385 [Actinomycetota bacterium]
MLIGLALVVTPRAEGQAAFGAGSGRSEAKILKVGPSRGALSLAPQVGLALSDFLNTRGRGDVRTVDFAALEDSIPEEVREALPTVKVESTDEASEAGKTAAIGTPPEVPVRVDAVELHADAGKAPYGASSFKLGSLNLGVGTIVGGRADARSGIVDGNIREATARVVVPRLELADGAVVLEGLEWRVVNRTGAQQVAEATFNLGGVTIAGQSFVPPADSEQPLRDVTAALAPVLGPLGIEITFPVRRIENGVVELSPLRIRVANSELGAAINPLLELGQPAREALVGPIVGSTDQLDAAILLTDVALGVLAGGSDLDIEVGGARTFTAEPAPRFSFGSFGLGTTSAPAASGAGSHGTFDVSSGGMSPRPTAAMGVTPGAPVTQARPEAEVPPVVTEAVASASERGGPLLLVGLLGLGAAASTGAADYRRLRSGRRVIPIRP